MTVWAVLAVIAAIIGIIGSVVPGIPGPPISWIGLLFAYLSKGVDGGGEPMTSTFLFIWLAITVAVTVLDYIMPAWFTRATGGHKAASTGAIIGLFAGMIIPPIGILAGSLLGAFLAEFLVEQRGVWDSMKASMGAFLGFILTTGMKLVASGIMCYYTIIYL